MFEVGNHEWTQPLESRPDVRLVAASAGIGGTGARFGLGAVYLRPRRVEAGATVVPIVDHLMLARLLVAAALACTLIWRLARG